mgnify:FL=1|jgi:hypothetical protein
MKESIHDPIKMRAGLESLAEALKSISKKELDKLVKVLKDHNYSNSGVPQKVALAFICGKTIPELMKSKFGDEDAGIVKTVAGKGPVKTRARK